MKMIRSVTKIQSASQLNQKLRSSPNARSTWQPLCGPIAPPSLPPIGPAHLVKSNQLPKRIDNFRISDFLSYSIIVNRRWMLSLRQPEVISRRHIHTSSLHAVVFKSRYEIDIPTTDFFDFVLGDIAGYENKVAIIDGLDGKSYTLVVAPLSLACKASVMSVVFMRRHSPFPNHCFFSLQVQTIERQRSAIGQGDDRQRVPQRRCCSHIFS